MKILISIFLCLIFLNAQAPSDGWISLFDGKSLDGWKAGEHAGSFKVENGMIVSEGDASNLYYDGPVNKANFKNFELKFEVMTKPGANTGIFFHTKFQESGSPALGYEVQINNTHSDWRRTGSLWGVVNIKELYVQDNEWFTMHIIVIDKQITVKINDKNVVDYTEPEDFNYADRSGRKLSSGTIAIGHWNEFSKAYMKNIVIKPLP